MMPKFPGWGRKARTLTVAIVVALGIGWYRYPGHNPDPFVTKSSISNLATVEVDQGDVALVVTEDGSLESSDDDVIRCRIESFLGCRPEHRRRIRKPSGPQAKRPRTTTSTATSTAESKGAAMALDLKSKLRAVSQVDVRQGVAKTGTAGAGGMSKQGGKSGASDKSVGRNSSHNVATADSSKGDERPVIRSFDYEVEPHIPLRIPACGPGYDRIGRRAGPDDPIDPS